MESTLLSYHIRHTTVVCLCNLGDQHIGSMQNNTHRDRERMRKSLTRQRKQSGTVMISSESNQKPI